jgi:hypothetical protein
MHPAHVDHDVPREHLVIFGRFSRSGYEKNYPAFTLCRPRGYGAF